MWFHKVITHPELTKIGYLNHKKTPERKGRESRSTFVLNTWLTFSAIVYLILIWGEINGFSITDPLDYEHLNGAIDRGIPIALFAWGVVSSYLLLRDRRRAIIYGLIAMPLFTVVSAFLIRTSLILLLFMELPLLTITLALLSVAKRRSSS